MRYEITPTSTGYHVVNYRGIVLYEYYNTGTITATRNGKYSRLLTNGQVIVIQVREPDGSSHTLGILSREGSVTSSYFSPRPLRSPRHFNPLTDYSYDNEMVEIDIGERAVFCNNVTLKIRETWTFHGLIINDEGSNTSSYLFLDGRPPIINRPGYYHQEHFLLCPT